MISLTICRWATPSWLRGTLRNGATTTRFRLVSTGIEELADAVKNSVAPRIGAVHAEWLGDVHHHSYIYIFNNIYIPTILYHYMSLYIYIYHCIQLYTPWFVYDYMPLPKLNVKYINVWWCIHQFNGHFRNLNWRYLPYIRPIFQAYVRGYTPKIWPEIWYERTSILGSWRSPIDQYASICALIWLCKSTPGDIPIKNPRFS